MNYLLDVHQLSIRQACRAIGIQRSVYYYQPDTSRDEPVIAMLAEVAERYPRWGFRKLFLKLRERGLSWNHKRVYRVYKLMNLNLRRRGKKRLPSRNPQPLSVPEGINQCWSMDFMHDALICGRRFRTFNIVDDFNREALSIEIDLNLPAARVIRTLERVVAWRGLPSSIRVDNGPEFISIALAEWAEENEVLLDFIEPGKPTQNAYVERFNRTYRTEVLDFHLFRTLTEVREITDQWLNDYNGERPHESLGDLSPWAYLAQQNNAVDSNYCWQ